MPRLLILVLLVAGVVVPVVGWRMAARIDKPEPSPPGLLYHVTGRDAQPGPIQQAARSLGAGFTSAVITKDGLNLVITYTVGPRSDFTSAFSRAMNERGLTVTEEVR